MLHRLALVFAVPLALSSLACDESQHEISIWSRTAPVGIPLTVTLDSSEQSCEEEKGAWLSEPETRCTTIAHPLEDVRATCDDDACEIAVVGGNALRITGRRAGVATLRVRAKDEDGNDRAGSAPLTFVTARDILVAQDRRPDGSDMAVMIGASARWSVGLAVDAEPSRVELDDDQLKVETFGDAVELTRAPADPSSFVVAFRHAGAARVRFSIGPFSATRDVRVASSEDVVAIEVHTAHRDRFGSFVVDPGTVDLLTPPTDAELIDDEMTGARRTFASVLVLRDGSKALGGAGFFALVPETTEGISLYAHDGLDPSERSDAFGTSDSLGRAFFDLRRVIGVPKPADGKTRVAAAVGDGRGEWPVLVR
jgi:hypothetical protein